MSITFGSVGDIIGVCQLVQSAVIALKDSAGSSAQFQELSRTLAKLTTALSEVAKLESSQRDSIDTTSVLSILEQFNTSLTRFLSTTRKYEPSLREGGTGNVIKDSYRKLRWPSQKEDVERFQRDIGSLLAALQVVLSTVGINIQVQGSKKINFRFDEMGSLLQQILAFVQTDSREGVSNQVYGAVEAINKRRDTIAAIEGPSKSVPFSRASTIGGPATPVLLHYETARTACIDKVTELVKECRRTNQRYRDAYFDLQDDVFYGNRLCLRSIDNEGNALDPGGVSFITEIFDKPQFFIANPTADDLAPAQDGFQWLSCAVTILSNLPGLIERLCVARDEVCGVYGFVFSRDGEWFSDVVDDRLCMTYPLYDEADPPVFDRGGRKFRFSIRKDEYQKMFRSGSSALYFGACSDPNQTWLPILEKAYAKAHGDYASIMNGFVGEGVEDLTGGVTFEVSVADILDREFFWKDSLLAINKSAVFSCYWKDDITKSSRDARSTSLLRAVEIDGERLILLRGTEIGLNWAGPWSDGSKEWTAHWMSTLNHDFGDDNVTWMSYSDFLRQFEYLNYTRIFDAEWSRSQQWAAFKVPKNTGETISKFRITLKSAPNSDHTDSIIALSQLDTRYFLGLQGRYEYLLGFRIFDADGNYILRTKRCYTLNRSCAVEVSLSEGSYIIQPRIVASKLSETNVIEDWLHSDDRKKRDKLLRIALSRDLAYAKVKESPIKETIEDAADDWNAICNLGLKVYVRHGESSIEVLWDGAGQGGELKSDDGSREEESKLDVDDEPETEEESPSRALA